jgi:hypothetical protein
MRRDTKRRAYARFRSAGARRLRHSATRTPPSASARTPRCLGIAILVSNGASRWPRRHRARPGGFRGARRRGDDGGPRRGAARPVRSARGAVQPRASAHPDVIFAGSRWLPASCTEWKMNPAVCHRNRREALRAPRRRSADHCGRAGLSLHACPSVHDRTDAEAIGVTRT